MVTKRINNKQENTKRIGQGAKIAGTTKTNTIRLLGGGSGVVNRTGPNASGEVTAFNPNTDEAFRTQRGSFFFCTKRVAGIVVLQTLQ